LIRFCLATAARLDIDDFDDSIFVINSVASFSRTQLKAGAFDYVAKISKGEVLI
jgi:hypothetical protein